MIRDNYLDMNKIIQDKKVLKLFRVVESHGGALRFVGGAVRDALAGLKGFDLDLATDLSPDELVEACSENGLRTVPIGIKFGTVGVIINDKVLEVTSLRRDVKTDGRHAVVEFTTDWEADASRRDLTINAVYADEKGNVFDYYNGLKTWSRAMSVSSAILITALRKIICESCVFSAFIRCSAKDRSTIRRSKPASKTATGLKPCRLSVSATSFQKFC